MKYNPDVNFAIKRETRNKLNKLKLTIKGVGKITNNEIIIYLLGVEKEDRKALRKYQLNAKVRNEKYP